MLYPEEAYRRENPHNARRMSQQVLDEIQEYITRKKENIIEEMTPTNTTYSVSESTEWIGSGMWEHPHRFIVVRFTVETPSGRLSGEWPVTGSPVAWGDIKRAAQLGGEVKRVVA